MYLVLNFKKSKRSNSLLTFIQSKMAENNEKAVLKRCINDCDTLLHPNDICAHGVGDGHCCICTECHTELNLENNTSEQLEEKLANLAMEEAAQITEDAAPENLFFAMNTPPVFATPAKASNPQHDEESVSTPSTSGGTKPPPAERCVKALTDVLMSCEDVMNNKNYLEAAKLFKEVTEDVHELTSQNKVLQAEVNRLRAAFEQLLGQKRQVFEDFEPQITRIREGNYTPKPKIDWSTHEYGMKCPICLKWVDKRQLKRHQASIDCVERGKTIGNVATKLSSMGKDGIAMLVKNDKVMKAVEGAKGEPTKPTPKKSAKKPADKKDEGEKKEEDEEKDEK